MIAFPLFLPMGKMIAKLLIMCDESKDIIDELKVRVPDVKDRIFSSIEGAGIDGWVRH